MISKCILKFVGMNAQWLIYGCCGRTFINFNIHLLCQANTCFLCSIILHTHDPRAGTHKLKIKKSWSDIQYTTNHRPTYLPGRSFSESEWFELYNNLASCGILCTDDARLLPRHGTTEAGAWRAVRLKRFFTSPALQWR